MADIGGAVDEAGAGAEAARGRALGLIAEQPTATAAGAQGASPALVRLCHAIAAYLDVSGAAVSLMGHRGPTAVAASTDAKARAYVELQITAGEGPCIDAHRDARPVLVPDLAQVDHGRWPGYLALVIESGLAAVFSLPLHVGAVRLGVLDIFATKPVWFGEEQLATMLAFARIATETVLDEGLRSDAEGRSDPLDALDYRAEIYQAQGMLMVRLGVGLAEALVRMRAYAFAHRRPLSELAREIVEGRTFEEGDI